LQTRHVEIIQMTWSCKHDMWRLFKWRGVTNTTC